MGGYNGTLRLDEVEVLRHAEFAKKADYGEQTESGTGILESIDDWFQSGGS
jgi:hypothetical protein